MKKISMLLIATIIFAFLPQTVTATSAQKIIDRYNEVSGYDKWSKNKNDLRIMMEMEIVSQGMVMPMKAYMKYDPLQMHIETSVLGENILIIINNDKGWMMSEGHKLEMPEESMQQLINQNDLMSKMHWDPSNYDLELMDPFEEDGKTYDVVKATPKVSDFPTGEQIIYFDRETGYVSYMIIQIKHMGKSIESKIAFEDVIDIDGIKVPKKMITKTTPNAEAAIESVITIKAMDLNYPMDDSLFAEPD